MVSHIHTFAPGAAITMQASTNVIGGRLVEISGSGTVAHAGAVSAKVFGAAATDAKSGEDVLVLRGGAQKLLTSAAIAAGVRVAAAADGKIAAVTGDDRGIGLTIKSTTAADQLALVALD